MAAQPPPAAATNPSGEVRRLIWGADIEKPAGWITADSEGGAGVDIDCDISVDGLPLATESIDCAYGRHSLQRLRIWDLWSAIRELHRVLRPGGILRLGLADLDQELEAYRRGQHADFWSSGWNTLSGRFITQLVEYGYLRTPLNFEFAEEMLISVGFDEVRRAPYRQTTASQHELAQIDCRPSDSFYVEAFKWRSSLEFGIMPGPADQVHLSWTNDPSTTLVTTWHTPGGQGPGFIEYRCIGTDDWTRKSATIQPSPGRGFLRRVALRGLLPNTAYEYRVSGDSGAVPPFSNSFHTRTAPPGGVAEFSFAFICDTGLVGREDGNASGISAVLKELLAEDVLFILGGGDYAYSDRDRRFRQVGDAVDAWFIQMEPLLTRRPLMAQYGNHDVLLNERLRDWSPRFAHPEGLDNGKCYSFDIGDTHFSAFFAPGPELAIQHLLWLDNDLASARRAGARWLIVFQHEPIYGHGHSHPAIPKVRDALVPILQKNRVSLHISGHDQNYERTYPLAGPPGEPTATSRALDRYDADSGVIYAKVSPAGKLSDIAGDFSRFTRPQPDFVAVRDDNSHHYAIVDVLGSHELKVSVYGVSDGGLKTLIDSFSVVAVVNKGGDLVERR